MTIRAELSGPALCLDLLQGLAPGDAGMTLPSALAAARAEQLGCVLDSFEFGPRERERERERVRESVFVCFVGRVYFTR